MSGKGDKLRKGANLKLYYENFDEIFRKKPTTTEPESTVGELSETCSEQFSDVLPGENSSRD